jgi:hypothetical protein
MIHKVQIQAGLFYAAGLINALDGNESVCEHVGWGRRYDFRRKGKLTVLGDM